MLEKTTVLTDSGPMDGFLLTCTIQTMQYLSDSGLSRLRGHQKARAWALSPTSWVLWTGNQSAERLDFTELICNRSRKNLCPDFLIPGPVLIPQWHGASWHIWDQSKIVFVEMREKRYWSLDGVLGAGRNEVTQSVCFVVRFSFGMLTLIKDWCSLPTPNLHGPGFYWCLCLPQSACREGVTFFENAHTFAFEFLALRIRSTKWLI